MNSVIKGAGYILAHVPEMVMQNGTTQTTERVVNPDSEFLKELPSHIRSYAQALAYAPNQTYIGNMTPDELAAVEQPWYDKPVAAPKRYGPFGEIMPEEEFLLLLQICDTFELVRLEKSFVAAARPALEKDPLITPEMLARLHEGVGEDDVERFIGEEHAEPLRHAGKTVGYVRRAHDVDQNLSAHVMLENLASKASGVLALLHCAKAAGIDKTTVDYCIDCAEEACGDMNQRGGGNFAKAGAEIAGFSGATGSDVRAFCAAPAHALIEAASLVKAGTYRNVVVYAGGCTAKLGMNSRDHVKKGLPVLEDCLGGFAVLVSANDGVSPEIDTDVIGRHTVGTGSSPQAVITALVADPLDRAGLKLTDVDRYAPELQNPDITKPAGAGDVPQANYKMIAALAVKRGELERADLAKFTAEHGLTGWAPTQGHIPSGVPYLGFCREDILSGKIKNAMIIGKGSLFLGRMTNLFDGVSVLIRANAGEGGETSAAARKPRVAVTGIGSEHGEQNVLAGAVAAARSGEATVLYIGTLASPEVTAVQASDEAAAHKAMEELLSSGKADAAVTMHYPFPIGVATVGRVVAPATGREVFIATATGTASTDRAEAMTKNAVYGIIAAKCCGNPRPTVGILNLDGARQAEANLKKMASQGYEIAFAESGRADGGCVMRGNDLLTGACDVMVCDSLTGNVLVKTLSAYTGGGSYETTGFGYGPGIGEGFPYIVNIVSRASGAPVIANAIRYAAQMAQAGLAKATAEELDKARAAGLPGEKKKESGAAAPAKEVVTAAIAGIEIMDLEDGVQALWQAGIYAESGMGCTGPVILVSEANAARAKEILTSKGFVAE